MANTTLLGLDIGTTKICASILAYDAQDQAHLLGTGISDSKGIKKGFVSNLDKLIDSISKAAQAAEDKAGVKARRVVANISGPSLVGRLQDGLIFLSRRGREITKRDVKKVIDTTKHISYTMEKDLLYAVPQEFTIDEAQNVEDPVGLFGTKLKVRLYVITALTTHIQNIAKAVNYAGYDLVDIVPTTVAAASGLLRKEEKTDGAVIIDIGGGVTELAVFKEETFRFFDSINVGGMDLTSCLSSHYNIPFASAEMIKRHYGGISKDDLKKDENNILDIGDRQIVIKSGELNSLLKERFDEIFHILKERLKGSGYYDNLIPSIIITGGSALLHGALESFEDRLKIRVRMGSITGVKGDPSILNNPLYSAAISIAKYGLDKEKARKGHSLKDRFFIVNTFHKFRDFLEDYF
ncbi:MAG: cell division protein FtsA [Candidatus Omnitrophota bacterium]